jgi:hypothetical protein
MIYSVFDWDSGKYDYYRGVGDKSGYRPVPHRVFNEPNGKGVPIEAALPVLPHDAQKIGRGENARGRVAVTQAESLAAYNPLEKKPWVTLGLWVGAFIVGTKVITWIGKRAGGR